MLSAVCWIENVAFAPCGRKKGHSQSCADSLIFPWQPILNGYDKAILTFLHGKTCDISSILDVSPTPNFKYLFYSVFLLWINSLAVCDLSLFLPHLWNSGLNPLHKFTADVRSVTAGYLNRVGMWMLGIIGIQFQQLLFREHCSNRKKQLGTMSAVD